MHKAWLSACFFIFLGYHCHPQTTKPGGGNSTPGNKPEKTILFSGYEWVVRNTNVKQGPGPNYFNERCVWVDNNGFLHLIIQKDSATGEWLSAEVTTKKSFGFGEYEFAVEGAVDKLDKNIVLGLFNYSGNDGLDEIDIEFARWGKSIYPNLNYTVWPAEKQFKNYSFEKEFSMPGLYSTHRFYWKSDSIIFTSLDGIPANEQSVIAKNICTSPPSSISRVNMPVHINLWLFDGNPPDDKKTVELVIRAFVFKGPK
jgi:hypothetical protein